MSLASTWAVSELEDLARCGQVKALTDELCAAARAWSAATRTERAALANGGLTDAHVQDVHEAHDYLCLVARRFDEAYCAVSLGDAFLEYQRLTSELLRARELLSYSDAVEADYVERLDRAWRSMSAEARGACDEHVVSPAATMAAQ